MGFLSYIYSLIQKDAPVDLTAGYQPSADDRRFIDNQIQGIEQHLVDSLIQGRHASWFRTQGAIATGDVACPAGTANTDGFAIVTKAASTPLSNAKGITGVVVRGAADGALALVALSGTVPSSVTGLASGAPGVAVVNGSGQIAVVGSANTSSYVIGSVNGIGELNIAPVLGGSQLIVGGIKTYTLSGSSAALVSGDVVALDAAVSAGTNITRGDNAALVAAGGALGVVEGSFAPGSTGITVVGAAGTTRSTAADLGTSSSCDFVVVVNHRAVRAANFLGGCVLGVADPAGTLTVRPQQFARKSARYDFSFTDFGAVADCDPIYFTKLGDGTHTIPCTDNTAAWNAMISAAGTAGTHVRLRIPAGPAGGAYGFLSQISTDSASGVCFDIEGDAGGSATVPYTSAVFAFDPTNPAVCESGALLTLGTGSRGGRLSRLTVIIPQYAENRQWAAGLTDDVNKILYPTRGCEGVVYRGQGGGKTTGSTEPYFPRRRDVSVKFPPQTQIFVVLDNNPVPYRYSSNSTAGYTSLGGEPYAGAVTTYNPTATPNGTTAYVPTTSNGFYFSATTIVGVNGTEPVSWPTTPGATVTTGGGNVYTCAQRCWPRTVGFSMTDGDITWTLVDASGQYTTNVGGGANQITWKVVPGAVGILAHGVVTCEDNRVRGVYNAGWKIFGNAAAFGIDASGGHYVRNHSVNCAGRGIWTTGPDANACLIDRHIVEGCADWGIDEDSFLGCIYYGCRITYRGGADSGIGTIRSLGINGPAVFYSLYLEGSQKPARLQSQTVTYGRLGSWSTTADSVWTDDGALRNGPRILTASAAAVNWAPLSFYKVGDTILPPTLNHFRYLVTATTGDGTTGISSTQAAMQTAFNSHVAVGGTTFTETTGTGSITYQCVGPETGTVFLGNRSGVPEYFLQFTDPTTSSTMQFVHVEAGYFAIQFSSNAVNNAIKFSTVEAPEGEAWPIFTYGLRWSSGHLQFIPGTAQTSLQLTGGVRGKQGEVVVNKSPTQVGDPFAWMNWGDGTVNSGVVVLQDQRNTAALRVETAQEFDWDSGSENATTLPATRSKRRAIPTTDATANVVVDSYTVPTGATVLMSWLVAAKQTAGTGSPTDAVWKVTAAFANNSGVVTRIDADGLTPGSANTLTPGASPASNINGTAVELRVTGTAAKTYAWRVAREVVEGV